MPQTLRPVVLMTDFGPDSMYVGQMKLVLERTAPGVRVIDLAHDLPPQDVRAGVLTLRSSCRTLPKRCILAAIVDPGVGSIRKIIAAKYRNGVVAVMPDNGLMDGLSELGAPTQVRVVANEILFRKPVSPVFHGRDIIAPVAARLAKGMVLSNVGPTILPAKCVRIDWPEPVLKKKSIEGEVVFVDRFGNAITNIPETSLRRRARMDIRCARQSWPLSSHYAKARRKHLLALVGSHGFLELAVCNGSAAWDYKIRVGMKVIVRLDLTNPPR